jgi:hypothetical protein
MDMKLSIYTFLFNARVRDFDLDGTIANFAAFADEVVIATLSTQEDDTLARLRAHEAALYGKLKVVVSDINPLKDNRFDGNLKTAAMRACAKDNLLVIADCDERFLVRQRPLWDQWAARLSEVQGCDGLLVPVLDLYGSRDTIRADQAVGCKFRLHKHTVVRRGVPAYAERANGLIATNASDTTEPLLLNGQLASFGTVVQNPVLLRPQMVQGLKDTPLVVHEGWLDLERRAKLGREWWKSRWEERSGHKEDVPVDKATLERYPVIKHHLDLS